MKTLLLALVLMTSAIAAHAERDVSNEGKSNSVRGEQDISIEGDKILFQANSTYVSSLYNKSLCVAGNEFHAVIDTCLVMKTNGDHQGDCAVEGKMLAIQPIVSTREICKVEGGRDQSFCRQTAMVPFVQSPVRAVKWVRKGSNVMKAVTFTVPACSAVVGD